MTSDDFDHPADRLAVALDRASGLLNTIADLFNQGSATYAVGNNFVDMAVTSANGLLSEARRELDNLHYSCDLTIVDRQEVQTADVEPLVQEPIEDDAEVIAWPNKHEVVAEEVAEPAAATPVKQSDDFAQSYLELLRKLTAAEVFAAEQQALSAPGTAPDLLPLLRSLREDLQKLHSAA